MSIHKMEGIVSVLYQTIDKDSAMRNAVGMLCKTVGSLYIGAGSRGKERCRRPLPNSHSDPDHPDPQTPDPLCQTHPPSDSWIGFKSSQIYT